jgi:hypothetical protein
MAQSFANDMIGCFTEKEFGKRFTYKMNPDKSSKYPHLVVVGPDADQVRMALVKKTVAYVVVGEDFAWEQDGGLVVDKWQIKRNWVNV